MQISTRTKLGIPVFKNQKPGHLKNVQVMEEEGVKGKKCNLSPIKPGQMESLHTTYINVTQYLMYVCTYVCVYIYIIIQQVVQCFHIFLRPFGNYSIFFLQLLLSFQSSSINPFSPISPLIPSAQVRLGLPCIYRVSQEECARFRESVPYVKLYRYNPKHLYPKLNGYGDNGQRSLKL